MNLSPAIPPLTCLQKGFLTTQWDMYVAEDIGFEKLDILSQRGIGHIKETAEIILKNRAVNVDVHKVQEFKKDEKVKHLLQGGGDHRLLLRGKSCHAWIIEKTAM